MPAITWAFRSAKESRRRLSIAPAAVRRQDRDRFRQETAMRFISRVTAQ
jgi:hypothetical protein